MKVLITGIPGWLGSRFLEYLVHNYENQPIKEWDLRCFVLAGLNIDFIKKLSGLRTIEIVTGDITKRETIRAAVKDIDVVFHLAGIIHARCIKELYQVNTIGTLNLIREASAAGVKRFVYISSNSAAGINACPHKLMKEEDSPDPYLGYGLSKYYAECMVKSFQETGKIETVILRPCWFYGPNQPARQNKFFKMIQQGNPIIFGKGLCFRSMSYLDNTCQAMVLTAHAPQAAGQTYWIADARPYTVLEIYDQVAELLGVKNYKPVFVPEIVAKAFYGLDKVLQKCGLYQTEIHVAGEMNKNIACSIEKARREIGYDPKIELKEGMRRSVEWFLNQEQNKCT